MNEKQAYPEAYANGRRAGAQGQPFQTDETPAWVEGWQDGAYTRGKRSQEAVKGFRGLVAALCITALVVSVLVWHTFRPAQVETQSEQLSQEAKLIAQGCKRVGFTSLHYSVMECKDGNVYLGAYHGK